MSEGLQKRMTKELELYKEVQKDLQKVVVTRQKLDAQLNENTLVKQELNLLDSECTVFKMIGPVLVKQDPDEAKQNVQKRIDYITAEIKRQESLIEASEKKQEKHRENLSDLQRQFQQQQVKAAARA